MQALYKLEQQMREAQMDWQQRTKKRQRHAVPILQELKTWMEDHIEKVLPKSPLGQAIAYTLPRWEGLSAYATHG